MKADLIAIWFIFIIPFGIYALYKFLKDREKSFQEYLIPELDSKGFRFISSTNYYPKLFEFPFDIPDEDIFSNPFGGRLASFQINLYSIYREVVFQDKSGKQSKALASIDFDGFFFRKFKRVRWKPDLK